MKIVITITLSVAFLLFIFLIIGYSTPKNLDYMIESMPYYLKYYNADWNIRYLNGQIREALERLNNHSDTNPADFSSLIDSGSDI